jgi:hypothetical protein
MAFPIHQDIVDATLVEDMVVTDGGFQSHNF